MGTSVIGGANLQYVKWEEDGGNGRMARDGLDIYYLSAVIVGIYMVNSIC